jgi:sugar-phosphatase
MLGFDARDCIVVEDVPAGIQAGRSAGARVIALCTTMAESELRKASADWILRDCSGISASASDRERQLSLTLAPMETEESSTQPQNS